MQEAVDDYLKTLLTNIGPYKLTPAEHKQAERDKASFIMSKLMRKKFRRRISENTRTATLEKITKRVKGNQPIHLVIPFGGYKHFWNQSHPEPDWAELFHLRWMTEYVLPILAVYKPGVVIEYVSEDLILPLMNNYPEDALDSYSEVFRTLIEWYSQYLPNNLELSYWRVGEKYDKQVIIDKVKSLLPERKAAFAKLSPDKKEQEIHRSLRSVLWDGKKDLASLTDKQKRDRVEESRLIELAFYDVEASPDFVGEYYWQDDHICVCFSFGLSPDNDEYGDLTLQSAPGSSVDHWIGRGVIKLNGNKIYGTIISQQQYDAAKGNLQNIKLENKLLSLNNYQSIDVINSAITTP